MTIESEIETALLERVASLVLSPVLPVAWDNKDFTPPADGTYMIPKHYPNGTTRYSIAGGNATTRIGFLQLTIITPLNKGATFATDIAGEVAAYFPDTLVLFEGDAKVFITKYPELARAIKTNVSWDVPITVPYHCNA